MKNLIYTLIFSFILIGCSDVKPKIAPQVLELQGEDTAVIEGYAGSVAVNFIPNDTSTTADDISVAWFDVNRVLATGDEVRVSELKKDLNRTVEERINVWFPRGDLEKYQKVNHHSAQILVKKVKEGEYRFRFIKGEIVPIYY